MRKSGHLLLLAKANPFLNKLKSRGTPHCHPPTSARISREERRGDEKRETSPPPPRVMDFPDHNPDTPHTQI